MSAMGCPVERRLSVRSALAAAAAYARKTAAKAYKMGKKVAAKYGNVLKAGACKLVRSYCPSVCEKVVDSLKNAIQKLRIPKDCIKGAFKVGCKTLCNTVCPSGDAKKALPAAKAPKAKKGKKSKKSKKGRKD